MVTFNRDYAIEHKFKEAKHTTIASNLGNPAVHGVRDDNSIGFIEVLSSLTPPKESHRQVERYALDVF